MSLVEVLVALIVLSIGLLGIAQVLIHGVRTSHAALLRTQAVNLVADMAERVRAGLTEDDLAQWQEAVRTSLPAAEGNVRLVAPNRYHISVAWAEALSERADVVVPP